MRMRDTGPAAMPETAAFPLSGILPQRRVVNAAVIMGVVGMTLFIATEAYAAAALSAWAVGGLLHLGQTTTLVIGGLFAIGATAATVASARLAWHAETDPENN
ncbi:hypothetical protein CSC94_06265 [Zhengella mangrovi]|uniref:Uncharacterized protein n=1 Tax=Zhengella mangrovi TaxID=1982044 RepID=A0A2G1QRY1_9HYPH|nr:hypothetical protein [Zhengella mangrovi]PHP68252.1 hypothetical protein CSC94_06265 [Zhengella mangrovi]